MSARISPVGAIIGSGSTHVNVGHADRWPLPPAAREHIDAGDATAAYATFDEAARIGARFGNTDLMTPGGLGRGQALILFTKLGLSTRSGATAYACENRIV
jgi:hypothetical protein